MNRFSQEDAANRLISCIDKYIAIYHKYNRNNQDSTYSQDICVVKVLSVTRAQFMTMPKIKIQFHDGKTAELTYDSQYKGHLLLHWDYMRMGRRFNDMFVAWNGSCWNYTYDDSTSLDYFLTNGDLHVKFFENDTESRETILFYNEKIHEASVRREENRIPSTRSQEVRVESVAVAELDRLFMARA